MTPNWKNHRRMVINSITVKETNLQKYDANKS